MRRIRDIVLAALVIVVAGYVVYKTVVSYTSLDENSIVMKFIEMVGGK